MRIVIAFLALIALVAPPLVAVDEKFAAAEKQFLESLKSDSADAKQAALEQLIAFGNPDASAMLVGEFGRVAEALREQEQTVVARRYTLERLDAVIADLARRAERDETLQSVLKRERERRDKLVGERDRAHGKVEQLTPWRDALSSGMARLFEAIGVSKRKKAELDVWNDVEEHPDTAIRIASVELLGRVGGPGTAVMLNDLIVHWRESSAKLADRLRKAMADVREMEQRLQRDSEQNSGAGNRAMQDQYDAVKKEGAQIRSQITLTSILCDTAVTAGGRALAREADKDLEKSLQKIVASARKAKGPVRLDTFALLGRADSPPVREQVRALLESEQEPAAIAQLLDGIAAMKDLSFEKRLIERYVPHESWLVRSRVAAALATLRSREAIPVLIARLETEQEGRVRTDVGRALVSLTAKDFHGNLTLWKRWWADNGATFVVPPAADQVAPDAAEHLTGVSFFGIDTESTKVLFVLDLSGSMNFAMIPRNNPDDDPNRPYDEPRDGEESRLQVAKRDLVKAISGLKDGGVFNIVCFASDVWTWADDLVTMSPDARAQVVHYVEKEAEAVGGTNIYGSMERAFELAGAKDGDQWSKPEIDTIYLLTDGKPSVGLTTDPEEILAFVRERNKTSRITIHTIGLSNAHDAVLLRRMAEDNGGKYVGR